MSQSEKIITAIGNLVAQANGRGLARTLGNAEVAQVLAEALRDSYGYTTGGSVAKAYAKHGQAYTTAAFAVANGPDYVALKMSRINALGSPVTWAGPAQANDKSIRRWCERQTLYTLQGWLMLTRAECRLFIRSIAPIKISEVPDVAVTAADSLAAGNCRMTTERVAGWFAPRTAVPAKTLARAILRREPLLAPFAQRAILQAQRRASDAA